MREAADGETSAGQRLKVMELFQVTIADMTTRFMALPDQAGITGFCEPSRCLVKGGIPTPCVGAGHANALLKEDTWSPRNPRHTPDSQSHYRHRHRPQRY